MLPLYALWWAVLATGGGDLAAQDAWAGFAGQHGSSAYNLFWYGGMHTANYSLISPYLMAAVGVRALTVASGLAATWIAAVLVERVEPRRPLAPALLAALGLWGNVASGRTTFALGVAFGLAACLYLTGHAGRGNVFSSPAPTPRSPPWRPRSRGCSSPSSGRASSWCGGRDPPSPCCCRPRWWWARPACSSRSRASS